MTSETQETPAETPAEVVEFDETGWMITVEKRLSHLDLMVHEIHQFCNDFRPELEKAAKFLHNPVGAYLKSPARPRIPGSKS